MPADITPPPAPGLFDRAWKNRRTIAALVGLALGLVCPLLPVQLRAPCAIVATAARTWQVNGADLP